MRRLSALALGACALLLAAPAAAQQPGNYMVQGTGGDGSTYTGTLNLTATGTETFRVVWRVGNDVTTGTGLSIGRLLVAGYANGREPGVAVYEVQADGSMRGRWTQGVRGGVGTENLFPR